MIKSIEELNIIPGAKILVRADIDTKLPDTYRLDAGIKTLRHIVDRGAYPIICGHMGNPTDGDSKLSTQTLKPYYDEHLGENNYTLLENLKFDTREKEPSDELAKELASLADAYVNEAFATSHRNYASIILTPKYLPAYAGFRLEEEVNVLHGIMRNAKRPFIAIVGGAKIESKLPVVKTFLNTCDQVLLGGKLGLQWTDPIPQNLLIPADYEGNQEDIGPKTTNMYRKIVRRAKTIIWAGPMGKYEDEEFLRGTAEVAEEISISGIYAVVGGGDTISALKKLGWLDSMDFVSTGGGAMLNFIAQGTLPGLEALEDNA